MPDTFTLKNFEGPLDLLLLLIQKDEMQIVDIALHLLTGQLLHSLKERKELEAQADQLAILSHLLALKSRRLTPNPDEESEELILDSDTRIAIIEHLLDHCQFKDIAETLQEKELQSHAHFTRMLPPLTPEKSLPTSHGLEEVTLTELKTLFEKVYKEAKPSAQTTIEGHKWDIRDKIETLLALLTQQKELHFAIIFEKTSCKEELIVTFLAVLELIKQEKILVTIEEHELKFTKN